MKTLILAVPGFLALAACAHAPIREIETQEVVVTRTERAITDQQVRETIPPPPLPPRPAGLSAALDEAIAKLCEYVSYADQADVLIQHAAGVAQAVSRVAEPVCQRPAPSTPGG